jgi:hypothetical protein
MPDAQAAISKEMNYFLDGVITQPELIARLIRLCGQGDFNGLVPLLPANLISHVREKTNETPRTTEQWNQSLWFGSWAEEDRLAYRRGIEALREYFQSPNVL